MQTFTNQSKVIRRNEESGDREASLRIDTDKEKETVRIYKHQWGGKQEDTEIVLPQQFLPDLVTALQEIRDFLRGDT